MKFKDKKEYYSLRKFKGVGLASAVVGLALLTPSVMAEEHMLNIENKNVDTTLSVVENDMTPNKPIDKDVSKTYGASKVDVSTSVNNVSENVVGGSDAKNEVNKEKNEVDATSSLNSKLVDSKVKDDVNLESTQPVRSRRGKRDISSQESPYVSDKAKEVVHELNDTLVMKKEDTTSTSDTLFKLDEGLKVSEEEKAYVNTIKDAFNDLPELVRSSVNSLTIVRKPNGLYGYTHSKEGNVNMNMQYYRPESTHGEPDSLQQSVEVLGHEVGNIFNAKSFRDGDTWSFSRDPKYAELAKEVYGSDKSGFLIDRWASDFGSYLGWISGKSTPQTDGDHKIYAYMNSLFKGILTPREDRITPELKQAVEMAKASGKRLVYDGHVSLDATYKNVDSVQAKVDELNRAEVAKVAGISDSGHFKTYGINKLVTTRYTADGVDIDVPIVQKTALNDEKQIFGYTFTTKEVSHDGLLVEYKYNVNNHDSLDNETMSANLEITNKKMYRVNAPGKLRLTVKKNVDNFKIVYDITNLTTGVRQSSNVYSTALNSVRHDSGSEHRLGSVSGGYFAMAELNYSIENGKKGDNNYRLTARFYNGDTLLGEVHKDFVGELINHEKGDLANIDIRGSVDDSTNVPVAGIIKNGLLYVPMSLVTIQRSDKSRDENMAINKRKDKTWGAGSSVSSGTSVRVTVLNPDYKIASPSNPDFRIASQTDFKLLDDLKDSRDTKVLTTYGSNQSINASPTNSVTIDDKAFFDTVGVPLKYTGSDKSVRTDKVAIKVEYLDSSTGVEKVIDEKTVTRDVSFVNYDEKYSKYWSNDYITQAGAGIYTYMKYGDRRMETEDYHTSVAEDLAWAFDKYRDGQTSNRINKYNLSHIDSEKHLVLENWFGLNLKTDNTDLFANTNYTVRMEVPRRGETDVKPNIEEIVMYSRVNRSQNVLDTDSYRETVYWLDTSGVRHLVVTNKPIQDKKYSMLYSIPKEATAIEVDVDGKVPASYGPHFLVKYYTSDSLQDIKNENRYYPDGTSDKPADRRAYIMPVTFTNNNDGSHRHYDSYTGIQDSHSMYVRSDISANNERPNYLQDVTIDYRQSWRQVEGLEKSTEKDVDLTPILDTSFQKKQFIALSKGLELGDSSWHKEKTITFAGEELTLYTRDYNEREMTLAKNGQFTFPVRVIPTVENFKKEQKYFIHAGLLYKITDKDLRVKIGNDSVQALHEWEDRSLKMNFEDKIAQELGYGDRKNKDRGVIVNGSSQEIRVPRSFEFKGAQSIGDETIRGSSYHDGAGKQLSVDVDLWNSSQVVSKNVSVIQPLPKGDLNYRFDGVKTNTDYNVFYTSDEIVNANSSWSENIPAKVTGIKWVKKTPFLNNTVDKVGYLITVDSDENILKTSVGGAIVSNNNVSGNLSDVSVSNKLTTRNFIVRTEYRDYDDRLVRSGITSRELPVGKSVLLKDYLSRNNVNDYAWGREGNSSNGRLVSVTGDITIPKQSYDEYVRQNSSIVMPDNDVVVTFIYRDVTSPDNQDYRAYFKTRWNDGYVEPSEQELIGLNDNIRSFAYLPNESNQKLKIFDVVWKNGTRGKYYVNISIDPVKEPVTEIHKGITYQGDEEKDLGYKETTPGNNHTYTKVKSYIADDTGTFHESVTTENDVPAQNVVVTLGTKPTVKTETIPKGKRYEADPDQTVKGQETVIEGQDGVKTSTTRYTVNPTTGDITPNTTVENTEKIDTVVKVGNKEVITEPISIVTRYKAEPTLEKDVQETETTGRAGSREITVTYDVNAVDGTLSNPTRTTRESESMTPTIIKVGSVHKDIVETEMTTKYISDDTKVRDSREELVAGSKGIKTTTTTYEVDENTGATHSPTTRVDDQPMIQKVVKIGTKPTIDIEPIAITTKYIFDENLAYGQQIVEEKGSEGRIVTTTTYTMNESDGTTTADTPDVQRVAMVQRVIRIGVKPTVEETRVNFNTFYESDPQAEKDSRVDKVVGKVGKVTTTTTYSYDNTTGVVTPNKPTTVTEEAIDRIVKVGTRPNVVETPIDFTTTYEADPESQRDSKTDKVVGKKGTTTVTTTYSVDPKTGVVTENPSTTTVKDPVNAVIKVGTKSTEVVETLPSPKRFVKDATRQKDEEPLAEQGRTGSKTTVTTYMVDERTGVTTPNEQPPVTVDPIDTIVRVPAGDKVVEEKIAITTLYIEDPTKDFGYEEEISKGSEGKIVTTTTYNVDGQTGNVTEGGTTRVQTDMVQRIVKKGTKPKVVETPIDFTTTYEADPESQRDSKTDKVVGKKGTTTVTTTYSVDPKTGVVTENPSTTTVKDPVNAVIKVGTKSTEVVETLPSPKRFVKDATRQKDEEPLAEQGRTGSKTTVTTYMVDERTGVTTPNEQPPVTVDPIDTIVRVPAGDKVVEEKIAITTLYIEDPTKDFGYEEEISKGSEGKIVTTTTYNVDGQTGNVTEGGTTRVQTDMVQRVVRKGTKPKVEETPIDFTTRFEKDSTKPKGETSDSVIGVNGKVVTTTTYTLDSTTGRVTENPSTSETINPITHVVKVGAKDTIEVTPIELVTRYERDDELVVGKSTIVNAGKAGSITTTTTYDVNPTTGDVTESSKTSVTDEMIEKVVKVGTKPTVTVETRPITIRYVPKEDVSYGTRTVKSEGSATVITSTTNYTLNPDGSTATNTPIVTTTDGSDRVIEVGVQTLSVTIDMPYDVETKYDSSLEAGQTVVDQNGENGSKTITTRYSLNETTGDVTSNTTETSVQSKPKKVRIGTGVRSTNVRNIVHDIQFETENIEDRFLPKGKLIVENEGALGKDIETVVEQLFNGEVKKSESSSQRVLDPVKRVVRVGTYEFAKPTENVTIEPEEFNSGVVPNEAPIAEKSDYEGDIMPNDAPIAEKPNYEGGVVPNDYHSNVSDIKHETSHGNPDSTKSEEAILPNTGASESIALSVLGGLTLTSLLVSDIIRRKRNKDSD